MTGSNRKDEIFASLFEGNRRFREHDTIFRDLSEKQDPRIVVISCSDSRVSPSIVMEAPLGSIFEIRVAGDVIDNSVLASVEFALGYLDISGILVVGHTNCGAVTEAQRMLISSGQEKTGQGNSALDSAVRDIAAIISRNPINLENLSNAIKENTTAQMERLRDSSIIREREGSGSVVISAAMYELASGILKLI